jgi:hypothetical protein
LTKQPAPVALRSSNIFLVELRIQIFIGHRLFLLFGYSYSWWYNYFIVRGGGVWHTAMKMWQDAKKKCRLNDDDIALAKNLGLNPRSLIKNIPARASRGKLRQGLAA